MYVYPYIYTHMCTYDICVYAYIYVSLHIYRYKTITNFPRKSRYYITQEKVLKIEHLDNKMTFQKLKIG